MSIEKFIKALILVMVSISCWSFSMSPPSLSIYCDSCKSMDKGYSYLKTSVGKFGRIGPILDSTLLHLRLQSPSLDYIVVFSKDGHVRSKVKDISLIKEDNGSVKNNVEKVDFVYQERFSKEEGELILLETVCGGLIMGVLELGLGPLNEKNPRPYDFMKPIYGAIFMLGFTTILTFGREKDRVYFKYTFQ